MIHFIHEEENRKFEEKANERDYLDTIFSHLTK
jgi:hypothetical protein